MAIMAIDLGTTNTKVVIFEEGTGKVQSTGCAGYSLIYEKPGQMEQSPAEWWSAVTHAIRACMEAFGGSAKDIKAIGLSGQMVGFVPLDGSGTPLYNCITHMDTRCITEVEEMKKDGDLLKVGYNLPSFITSAPKLVWLKKNFPDVWRNTKVWVHPKDYIRYRMTGELCTEITDASDTLFLDFHTRKWDPVIEKYSLDINKFPRVYMPTDVVGEVTTEAAEATGLAKGTPVVAGAADMACAAIGTRSLKEGAVSVTIGTVGHLIAPIKAPSEAYTGHIFQFCHAVPGLYYAFGAVPCGGFAFAWFREVLESCMNGESINVKELTERLDECAERAGNAADDLFFLPYLTGAQMPVFDMNASGVFIGLKPSHKAGHMAKSVMEGVAFVFRQLIDLFGECGIQVNEIFLGDGGCKSKVWVNALKNIIGCEKTNLMVNKDSSPLGAAIIAGIGAGIYNNWDSAVEKLAATVQLPYEKDLVEKCEKRYSVFNSIFPALKKPFKEIADLNKG